MTEGDVNTEAGQTDGMSERVHWPLLVLNTEEVCTAEERNCPLEPPVVTHP